MDSGNNDSDELCAGKHGRCGFDGRYRTARILGGSQEDVGLPIHIGAVTAHRPGTRLNRLPGAYYYLRFFAPRFLGADFFAALADFLALLRAGLAVLVFDAEPRLPEKMLSQLSEYCFVAPTRTTLTVGCS